VTLPDRNGVFWWGYVAVLAGAALFIAYSFVGVFVPMLVLALYAGIRTFQQVQRRFEGDVVSLLLSRVVGFDVEGDGPVALLRDPPSVDQLTELLASHLPGGLEICFELTESELLHHHSHVVDLRDEGYNVVVDDFGTGYSSLSRLKEMPLDGLKLDMEFVHGITEDTVDSAIAETVTRLGALLDIPVIAEGIETQAQLDALQALGCDAGQGFFLARPDSFDGMTERLDGAAALDE